MALAQSRQGKEGGGNKKKLDIASLFEDKDAAEPTSLFKNAPKDEAKKGGRHRSTTERCRCFCGFCLPAGRKSFSSFHRTWGPNRAPPW